MCIIIAIIYLLSTKRATLGRSGTGDWSVVTSDRPYSTFLYTFSFSSLAWSLILGVAYIIILPNTNYNPNVILLSSAMMDLHDIETSI